MARRYLPIRAVFTRKLEKITSVGKTGGGVGAPGPLGGPGL